MAQRALVLWRVRKCDEWRGEGVHFWYVIMHHQILVCEGSGGKREKPAEEVARRHLTITLHAILHIISTLDIRPMKP